MTDEEILGIFSRNGMRIELGAQFSAKGQVAQLLNGCKNVCEILNKDAVLTPTAPDSEGQPAESYCDVCGDLCNRDCQF